MKFQLGDPVRVIATPSRYFDQTGTVHDEAAGQFHVSGLDTAPVWFYPHELILTERREEAV